MRSILTVLILSVLVILTGNLQAADKDRLILGMHYSTGDMKRIYELNRDGELWGQTFLNGEPVSEKKVHKRFAADKTASYFDLASKHMEVKLDTKGSLTRSWEIHITGKTHRFNWAHPTFNAEADAMIKLHREILAGL